MRTYVRTNLRLDAMRIRSEELTNVLQSVQLEVNRLAPSEQALRDRVKDLENIITALRRETISQA